jgi:hypothetical protein
MTNLQALKSLTEYRTSDDNIFTKALLDGGVSPTGTYSASSEQEIDLVMADIYLALAGHPDLTDGRLAIKYNPDKCLQLRKTIYDKWGLELPEITNQTNVPKITGKIAEVYTDFW